MSYSEVHRLPIRYRNWFLRRLAQHFEAKNKAFNEATSKDVNRDKTKNNLEKLSMFESQIKSKL